VYSDPDQVIKPAVEGAKAAMRAAHKHGVKRVVMTSSVNAVSVEIDPIPTPITEDNWSNLAKIEENRMANALSISKTRAEQAAWDYQAQLPVDERFELVTICPGLVLGKALVDYGFISSTYLTSVVHGENGHEAGNIIPCVEVEAVARAHFNAMVRPEAANNRFLVINRAMYFNEMAQVLHRSFPHWPSIPDGKNNANKGPEKVWARRKSEEILGIEYRDYDEVLVEMVRDMVERGYLKQR